MKRGRPRPWVSADSSVSGPNRIRQSAARPLLASAAWPVGGASPPWQVPPGISIGREAYRGRDEVQRGFAEWLGAWDTYSFELEEVLDHGDHVVVGGMQTARGRGSGVEVRLPTFHVFTLRDGKVTHHRSYRDRTEALEAAGLSE